MNDASSWLAHVLGSFHEMKWDHNPNVQIAVVLRPIIQYVNCRHMRPIVLPFPVLVGRCQKRLQPRAVLPSKSIQSQ